MAGTLKSSVFTQIMEILQGFMLESHLVEGNQSITDNLTYGQSITDACMNWDDTLNCLQVISEAVRKRRG